MTLPFDTNEVEEYPQRCIPKENSMRLKDILHGDCSIEIPGYDKPVKASTDDAIRRGFDALISQFEKAEKRGVRKAGIAEKKDNAKPLSHHQNIRQKWLNELARDMETFNMSTTGSSELDKAIRERKST